MTGAQQLRAALDRKRGKESPRPVPSAPRTITHAGPGVHVGIKGTVYSIIYEDPKMNELRGVVHATTDTHTVVHCEEAGTPIHLRVHQLINGSINQCPKELRVAGQPVVMEYRSTNAYGLWFARAA